MAGGRFEHWSVHILRILQKKKKSRVKQLYKVMESDAFSISAVYLMIWFSYHKGIQMWGISVENKGFAVLCARQIERVRLDR